MRKVQHARAANRISETIVQQTAASFVMEVQCWSRYRHWLADAVGGMSEATV